MNNITPRQAKSNAIRAQLIKKAREHFDAHGFDGAKLRDIAKAANRSTGAIFSRWDSKEALWADVYGKPYVPPEEELNRLKLLVRRADSFLLDSVKYAAEGRIPMSNYYAGQALSELEEILND